MLIGEFKHSIDTKGRLIMPSKFRTDLGPQFIVTKGLDGCLFGFPMDSWTVFQNKLKDLSIAKKEARSFVRSLYSAATEVEIDKQGRINLPQNLIELAGINKECRVIGLSDRIEIWSQERWATYSLEADENFDDIAETMIDFGF